MLQAGIERYLQASLDRCATWFRASGASIFLLDEDDGSFRLKAKAGRQSRIPADAFIRPGEGLAGQAILVGEAQLIQDDRRTLRLSEESTDQEIASSMIIPLLEPRVGVIGVLNLSRSILEPPFSEMELEQGRAMAAQVTLAVSNARLVERLNAAIRLSRESRERLAAVLDSVPGGVIVLDGVGQVVSASPWALNEGLFGVDPSRGAPPLEVEIRRVAEETLSRRAAMTSTIYDPAQDRTWMLQSQPMQHGGTVVSVQEITQHEKAQRDMHRLSRLAEIGRMTAAIAHEFRNPLTGIRSAAQMIQTSPELNTEFGKIIEDEVLKLNTLCTEFLEFAKPMTLARDEAVLSVVVKRVCELLKSDFDRAEIKLVVESPPFEPAILIDSRRIEQVLHNLLRNSLEATGKGGTVGITVGIRNFEVYDTGSGMDEEALSKLFSPFFTTKAHGTGLGLSTVQKIVEAHCGQVHVHSAQGKGTAFLVTLGD
jgi:signal transduction histidine kinase